MKNIIFLIVIFATSISSTQMRTSYNPLMGSNIDKRLEYLIGDWKSTGFVTDANGFNQYIEIHEKITAKGNEMTFTMDGINPQNGYRYNTTKSIFFDPQREAWHVKGQVKGKYSLDNKVYITDFNTVTYTFYDNKNNLMRYTILKENDNSFVETEEKWTNNGWDKTAWLRMERVVNNKLVNKYVTARPIH